MACFINKCIAPSFMVFIAKGLVQHFGGTYDKSVIYETTYNCSGSQELNWFTTAIVVKGKRCKPLLGPGALHPSNLAYFVISSRTCLNVMDCISSKSVGR